jgi:hypothetical protein
LLLKRPLIEIGSVLIAGFDPKILQTSIDLQAPGPIQTLRDCSRPARRQADAQSRTVTAGSTTTEVPTNEPP